MSGVLQIEFRELGFPVLDPYHAYLTYKEDGTTVWQALHVWGEDANGNLDVHYTSDIESLGGVQGDYRDDQAASIVMTHGILNCRQ